MKELLARKDMNDEQVALNDRGFSFDEDGIIINFNGNYFASYIKKNYNLIYGSDGEFYEYFDGVWSKVEIRELKQFLYTELQEPRHGVWSTRRENEYFESMKRMLYESQAFNEHCHLINMQNGMFDLDTLELIDHDPDYLSSIQIPISYDSEATCQQFNQFLSQVFEGDKERIRKAVEWYGYALSTETKAQKALILYGSGGNGKGVFTEILSELVGEMNLSHILLTEVQHKFARANLFNKTINICSENEMGGKSFNTQYFKAITGEDTISAEYKNKPVFSFKPTVKMIISMNNLPQTKDRSDGYYRRLDFLPFTKHFSEDEKDRDLKNKLLEELSGIFNLAIEGLINLRNNDYKFSKCQSSDDLLKQYNQELNPLISFFDECIEIADKEHRESNKTIYNTFKRWAEENGHKGYANISSQKFWKEFETEAKVRKIVTTSGRSNKFRYHTGIIVAEEAISKDERRLRAKEKQEAEPEIAELFSDEDVAEDTSGQTEKP